MYGPARIVLLPEKFECLKIYVEKARTSRATNSDTVFLSNTGNAIKSGDVSKRIHSLWVNAGIFKSAPVKNLSCNIIRKSASSGTREEGTGHYQEIADHMGHSKETAEEHYFTRKMQISSKVGGKLIRDNFYGSTTQASPRKVWTQSEEKLIENRFTKLKDVSLREVREKVGVLNELNVTPRKLYDKIRSMSSSPLKRKVCVILLLGLLR